MSNTLTRTLDSVTTGLGKFYKQWKDGEKAKNEHKNAFFQLATEESAETLAEKLASTPYQDEKKARSFIERYHPGWVIVDIREVEEGGWEAVIEEDPAYKKFTYLNKEDGMVYQRQIESGPTLIDEERMEEERPDLLIQISLQLPWGDRVLYPLDMLDSDLIGAIQPFMYQGKPKVKLAPPRPAKPEELE